ncbi:hypothetical protein [Usitatibacter palustris]|uniref:Glycine zipper n=1 Tax=Usitatibacter palustris TaxID=2732487 RepID=A0A6M4H1R6_9PROT|nr:hypothetical protein [Usitatibacter palustris]QJR13446.1 hypothetical protein DSM104440_00229 [Usitatibacter palustris]
MSTIIAGRFENRDQADAAVMRLRDAGVDEQELSVLAVNPPGQHDQYPIGGDRDESPGAKTADSGAAKGAAVGGAVGLAVGAATIPVLGPLGPIAGAGVGAYTGSLVGALNGMDSNPKAPQTRQAGTLVAVNASVTDVEEDAIARILHETGADPVERANGNWDGGNWSDFDPLRPPKETM